MDSLKKIQSIQTRMLKATVSLCEKHDIRYFITAGTLLGAVRHKGFIPWDDDIDIVIPRKDYSRFLEIALSELPEDMEIRNFHTYDGYHLYYMRVVDKNSKVIPSSLKFCERYTGVWLDVFPLDGTPENFIKRTILFTKVLYYKGMLSLHYNDAEKKRTGIKAVAVKCLKWYATKLNPTKIKKKLDKQLQKYDYDKSTCVGNFFGGYGFKEFFDKSFYGDGKFLEFEGIMVRAPQNSDAILKKLYGDYMIVPPENERVGHKLEIEYLEK